MDEARIENLLAEGRVGRLATIDPDGRPHIVPFVYAVGTGGNLFSAVDHKPKRTKRLRRLSNIAGDPRVSVLVDHYDDQWSQLWWIRIDGTARIIESGPDWEAAVECLAAKYPQYRGFPPTGPVIEISRDRVLSWQASADSS